MKPSTSFPTEGDDWRKTTNPRERKKIQDRLAQRTRRVRVRQAQSSSTLRPVSNAQDSTGGATASDPGGQAMVVGQLQRAGNRPNLHRTAINIDPDAFFLVLRCQTVIAALTSNASTIPVYCDSLVPKVLTQNGTETAPLALLPTELQSRVPHLAFVAALPFAGLRDSILKVLPYIDYNELWRDSVSGGFFVWGSVPWSPHGWEVTEEWAQKWWFLLDRELFATADFWRLQRGLPRLPRYGPPALAHSTS